jgi:hypothetical protein
VDGRLTAIGTSNELWGWGRGLSEGLDMAEETRAEGGDVPPVRSGWDGRGG